MRLVGLPGQLQRIEVRPWLRVVPLRLPALLACAACAAAAELLVSPPCGRAAAGGFHMVWCCMCSLASIPLLAAACLVAAGDQLHVPRALCHGVWAGGPAAPAASPRFCRLGRDRLPGRCSPLRSSPAMLCHPRPPSLATPAARHLCQRHQRQRQKRGAAGADGGKWRSMRSRSDRVASAGCRGPAASGAYPCSPCRACCAAGAAVLPGRQGERHGPRQNVQEGACRLGLLAAALAATTAFLRPRLLVAARGRACVRGWPSCCVNAQPTCLAGVAPCSSSARARMRPLSASQVSAAWMSLLLPPAGAMVLQLQRGPAGKRCCSCCHPLL